VPDTHKSTTLRIVRHSLTYGYKGNRSMHASGRPRAAGFTLVELLVVIAVIGLLVALLLPAVQAAREVARRLQCANNLRQLSLAVANYEATLGILPAAGIVDIDEEGRFLCRSGKMFSWAALILPYVEQETLHDRFDFNRSVLEQEGNPQSDQPPLMLCPTDAARGRMFVDADLTGGKSFGKGNYAAYCSTYHIDQQETPPGFPGAIVGHGQKLAEITDGTSNTLMLTEVRTRDHVQDQRGTWALPWAGSCLVAVDRHSKNTPRYVPDSYTKGMAQLPNRQGPIYDMLYRCADPSGAQWDRMPCATYAPGYPNGFLSAAPRSLHPGGVNASFVDGHVTFLRNDVNELLLAFMVCIEDDRILDRESAD